MLRAEISLNLFISLNVKYLICALFSIESSFEVCFYLQLFWKKARTALSHNATISSAGNVQVQILI